MTVDVSVIIPVYRAQETLARALASIDQPDGVGVEIILSIDDDGTDYSALAAADPRVRVLKTSAVKTGPGPARNRAVLAAKGAFLAYLDADDAWAPDYLSTLLPVARNEGCAFAPTRIERPDGSTLLTVPGQGGAERLMLSDFAKWGASFHPVHAAGLPRGTGGGAFWDALAQDVMHAVEVFMACGLTAALERGTAYCLRLGESMVTTADDFSDRLTRAYADYDAALADTWAQTLFAQKSALNDRYVAERLPDEAFYEFVARVNAA